MGLGACGAIGSPLFSGDAFRACNWRVQTAEESEPPEGGQRPTSVLQFFADFFAKRESQGRQVDLRDMKHCLPLNRHTHTHTITQTLGTHI